MDAVKLALAIALGGCATNLAPSSTWKSADEMTGDRTPSIGAAPAAAAVFTGTLRVVTYNIRDGGASPVDIAHAFAADPGLARADIVLLQEEEAFPGEAEPRTAALAHQLGMGWFYAPARATLDGAGTFGDAILSRFPMSELEVLDLPHAEGKLQRTATRAALDIGGTTLTVITTHLDTTINFTTRVLQLHPAVIDAPPLAIVGGDFNTNPYLWEHGDVPVIPDSVVVDTDQAAMLDDYMAGIGFANGTGALGNTEVRYGVESRLDAVYVRGGATGVGDVVRAVPLSDHWPVWVDIRIQP
jgi:endonuclease/exonuclease/phosphatase family metal-dependent hydrolase